MFSQQKYLSQGSDEYRMLRETFRSNEVAHEHRANYRSQVHNKLDPFDIRWRKVKGHNRRVPLLESRLAKSSLCSRLLLRSSSQSCSPKHGHPCMINRTNQVRPATVTTAVAYNKQETKITVRSRPSTLGEVERPRQAHKKARSGECSPTHEIICCRNGYHITLSIRPVERSRGMPS